MSISNDRSEKEIPKESLTAQQSSSNECTEQVTTNKTTTKSNSRRNEHHPFFPTINESRLRGLSPESRRKVTAEFYLKKAKNYERSANRVRRAIKIFRKVEAKHGSKYIQG